MKKVIRQNFKDKIAQFAIDNGMVLADITNPLALCKQALSVIEERNENRFINEVLNDLVIADTESLKMVKSLERLYKSVQVIAKATTQDKIQRFKKLTVNGILKQEELTDGDYELFVNLIDELTDIEFLILLKIHKYEVEHDGETFNSVISVQISKELLSDLSMDTGLFSSYVHRLKAKGLIVDAHGHSLSYDTPFFISMVDGKISVLFKKLLTFIEI